VQSEPAERSSSCSLTTVSSCAACAGRTVYVPHGTPVRLRETVKDVKVWVKDSGGDPVAGEMDLYEGWYSLPLEED
jgi:hypothetical protein